MTSTADTTFMAQAKCRGVDPELFHPERGQSQDQAKAICAECPVRDACLEYALITVQKHGVWGGTSERERRRLRNQRRLDGELRQCANPGCGVWFRSGVEMRRYHDDACRNACKRARIRARSAA